MKNREKEEAGFIFINNNTERGTEFIFIINNTEIFININRSSLFSVNLRVRQSRGACVFLVWFFCNEQYWVFLVWACVSADQEEEEGRRRRRREKKKNGLLRWVCRPCSSSSSSSTSSSTSSYHQQKKKKFPWPADPDQHYHHR
ncbi:hypothetical protein CsSME_00030736 [Camellia sinensis var. sinensis]